jgi:hypothetical protein
MIESFVDLTYRGLPLGRRVKLTQVRPSTGYLEMPAPMPVGTVIAISTDEGVTLEATVTALHEQVGGRDQAPGMTVAPTLGEPAVTAWWSARVGLPEEEKPEPRSQGITVRPRSHTIPAPPPEGALVASDAAAPEPGETQVMPAVDQALLEQLSADSSSSLEKLVRGTDEHAVVDDGIRTTVMAAVDPAVLGLEVSASGPLAAASDDEEDDKSEDNKGDDKKITGGGSVKKRKKKR